MEQEELIKIAEAGTETDALQLKAALEAVGVRAMISGLEASALGASLEGMDVIEIFVKPSQIDLASDVLDQLEAESEDEIPEWTCVCGEQVDAGFAICWSCGADYTPAS